MSGLQPDTLHRIGNTSLVPLRCIVPRSGSRIVLKIESENPTGSIKDRQALAMIEKAEADRLGPGRAIVEYTGGSTGVSLALVCAIKRHPFYVVSSDALACEKLDHIRILGGKLHVVESDMVRMTEKLIRDMIEAARRIAEETGAYWTDQLNNLDQLVAYRKMGEEIWSQTEGRIDAFVQSVGTAGSLRGVGEVLRDRNGHMRIVAVEPSESAVLSGGATGAHQIDGVGAGFVVPLWYPEIADAVEQVSTANAISMALRLAREEGLFAGTSTGANLIAALRTAEQLDAGSTVVTLMCDTGMQYLKKFGSGDL
jgi:cysteine synthase